MTMASSLTLIAVLAFPILVEVYGSEVLGSAKRHVLAVAVLLLLASDWGALHDVLGGREPDHTLEYVFLGLSFLTLVFLAVRWHTKTQPPLAGHIGSRSRSSS
ncbi:MAG: hypothetical protein ACE5JI_01395 [Acidobacteriota bacterium]